MPPNRMLLIEVPDETLVERGCGRRLDPETGVIKYYIAHVICSYV